MTYYSCELVLQELHEVVLVNCILNYYYHGATSERTKSLSDIHTRMIKKKIGTREVATELEINSFRARIKICYKLSISCINCEKYIVLGASLPFGVVWEWSCDISKDVTLKSEIRKLSIN